jgi:nucleoside-diphosphate-sugar epimerase
VREAVLAARPDVVVHQLTALSGLKFGRNFDKAFAMTNRLRTEGTDHLLAAAREAGVTRLVWQSFAGWPAAREGAAIKDENAAFDPDPPANVRQSLAAIKHLEAVVTEAGGTVLRYGGFYGPGTSLTEGGEHAELLRKRRFPVGGSGAGIWSLVHIDDAAAATVAAIESGRPGVFNIVDDEPTAAAELLPGLAKAFGAPAPRHFPGWLIRLLGGGQAHAMMTSIRGASNAKAKRELGWAPKHSWRDLGSDDSSGAAPRGSSGGTSRGSLRAA